MSFSSKMPLQHRSGSHSTKPLQGSSLFSFFKGTSSPFHMTGRAWKRVLVRFVPYIAMLLLVLLSSMFHSSIRNVLLYPVFPRLWRDISTTQLLNMHFQGPPSDVTDVTTCSFKVTPGVKRSDLNTSKMKFFHEFTRPSDVQSRLTDVERRFLPIISDEEKIQMFYTYLVLEEALRKANISFFFCEGALLGVHRHRGIKPWDDDIDVGVNASQWWEIQRALSCIEGFELRALPHMHWKFFPTSGELYPVTRTFRFPYIDLFFYTEDDEFIWSLAHYARATFMFRKSDVFPLGEGYMEGLRVPVPKKVDQICRKVFDYEMCYSPSSEHKTGYVHRGRNRSYVLCSSLSHMYDMYHLKY